MGCKKYPGILVPHNNIVFFFCNIAYKCSLKLILRAPKTWCVPSVPWNQRFKIHFVHGVKNLTKLSVFCTFLILENLFSKYIF